MLFAIDILLLDLDMLLPRLLLCVYLLCLAYLFLLPRTVPLSLEIALARLILFPFFFVPCPVLFSFLSIS